MRDKLIFILIALTLIFINFQLLKFEKNENIKDHLDKETEQFTILYNSMYNEFKNKAQTIYETVINNKDTVDIYKKILSVCKEEKKDTQKIEYLRQQLYNNLLNNYQKLRSITKLQQLHFHTVNNRSILRFHNFEKYNDDLSDIRPLISHVNKTKKKIDGFEVGRTYSGYRFIFPLKDKKGTHLGSVEISFDVSIFTKELMVQTNNLANFHIKKQLIDKKVWKEKKELLYEESMIKNFYTIKNNIKDIEDHTKKTYDEFVTSKPVRDIFSKKMNSDQNKPFSYYDQIKNYTITVLPVKDPLNGEVLAYLSTKHHSSFILEKYSYFNKAFYILSFFICIIVFLVYIVLKKEKQSSKLSSEQNFANLLTRIPNIAVQGYNKKREVIYWNKASELLYGYTKEEALGKPLEDLIIPDFMRDDVIKMIADWYKTGVAIPAGELPLKNKKGSTVFVYSSHIMLEEDSDEPKMFCVDIDLRENKKQQEELQQKDKLLAHQSKLAALGEMMDAIAHQWKQPLSVINALSTGMNFQSDKEGNIPKDIADKTVVQIEEQIKHLSETIDEFRQFFRPNVKKEPANIKQLINSVLKLEKNLLGKNNIETIVNCENHIVYDLVPTELKHVFINLINNTKDAFIEVEEKTPDLMENKKIIFDVIKDEEYLTILFSDNAGGIQSSVIDKIFEANITTKEKNKGTGIGLYMSKQIIEKINGKIGVENIEYKENDQIQKGARFFIKLPLS